MEDRCLGVLTFLANENKLNHNYFIRIEDPPSPFSEEIRTKIIRHVKEYDKMVPVQSRNINNVDLLAPNVEIVKHASHVVRSCGGNLVLDISSMPKRFFFPFIKILLKEDSIENLIVTYSTALKYDDGDIAADPEPWDHIPLFGPVEYPEIAPNHAIVGIGFIPFGLSKLIKDNYQETPVTFFFPFPPGPPNIHRSWKFLRLIEKSYNLKNNDQIQRVNSIDTSVAFNHLKSISDNGLKRMIFAPYGPKPISLAFAIYASLTGSPVYYTQPKKYSPSYCSGIDTTFAYCIKHEGNVLYKID